MGTEQQQEFKSVKSSTKPKWKVIPFTDHSIESWRPKKDKDRIGFVISNTTQGIKILYRKKTKQKYWELNYYLKKKELTTSLGPFIPDVRGTEYITKEMLVLIGKHKDMRRTHWLTDPKKTIKEKDQKVVIEKIKVEIDHFHNAASFVEMPENVVENYVKYLKKNKINQVSLISYDGYDLKTTHKAELLNNFFDNKLDIEWHPDVIKDYNNKLLYLTSKN